MAEKSAGGSGDTSVGQSDGDNAGGSGGASTGRGGGSSAGGSGDAGASGSDDRISQIMAYLNDPTMDTLPENLRFKYEDGWNPDKLEEELQQHPFFMTEMPDPTKPLPPLLEAFQQLKYSENENTSHELALNHKEDGLFHFKIKKYRIAATCFSTALSFAFKADELDTELVAQLYNNRSACMFFIGNYRSCIRDCEKALEFNKSYFKAVKRALSALEKIEKWDELTDWCDKWEEAFQEKEQIKTFCGARKVAMLGKAKAQRNERRRLKQEGVKKEAQAKVLDIIKSRGYKMRDWNFLEGDNANEGRVVFCDDDGELHWPVLLMYPQYSQSDLIEAFWDKEKFTTHLQEMLDVDPPSWDVDKEYSSDKVEIWYLGDKFIKINPESTLHDVLKEDEYYVPCTGVPSFFILSMSNQFCQDFKDRMCCDGVL